MHGGKMVGIQVTKFRIRGGGGGHFLREFKDECVMFLGSCVVADHESHTAEA